ncbi:MAG: GNAT family N-acetyltransferase [Planctomycetota bacterium]
MAGANLAGLDLSRCFGVVTPSARGPVSVRQACVAVPGAGRTAMLLISRPAGSSTETHSETDTDHAARVACIKAAASACRPPEIHLVQALPSPEEPWADRALAEAGFVSAGELAYLERSRRSADARGPAPSWPEGITAAPIDRCPPAMLRDALDASYEDTLDCPELFGLRSTDDIIESHRAVGTPHRGLWQIFTDADGACGCMMVSETADAGVSELVYLGLARRVRGRGLASCALRSAILGMELLGIQRLVCAVDRRNTPARRLYEKLGFREFSSRHAYVSSSRDRPGVTNV